MTNNELKMKSTPTITVGELAEDWVERPFDPDDNSFRVCLPNLLGNYPDRLANMAMFVDELWTLNVHHMPAQQGDGFGLLITLGDLILSLEETVHERFAGLLGPNDMIPMKGRDDIGAIANQGPGIVFPREPGADELLFLPERAVFTRGGNFISSLLQKEPSISIMAASREFSNGSSINNEIAKHKSLRQSADKRLAFTALLAIDELVPTVHPRSFEDALEVRELLKDYLVPFRQAMAHLSARAQFGQPDKYYEEQIYQIVRSELKPAITEMENALKKPSKRVLKRLIEPGKYTPILAGGGVLSTLAFAGGTAVAAASAIATLTATVGGSIVEEISERNKITDPRKNGLAFILQLKQNLRKG